MTHEEVVAKVTEADARSKSNTHRLDEHQRRLDDQEKLIATVSAIATKQDVMETDMKEIKQDIRDVKERPVRRGEALADKLVYAFLAALLTFLLSKMGIT